MDDLFIQKIIINHVRNITDFEISLSETDKRHLIITGKNGSGKTSVLNELKVFLANIINGTFDILESQLSNLSRYIENIETYEKDSIKYEKQIIETNKAIFQIENWLKLFGGTEIKFNKPIFIQNEFKKGDFIIAFFEAKRNSSLKVPTGINKINLKPVYNLDENAGIDFIQYIVNLKADRSFAKDDKDTSTANKIDVWFESFENSLFQLFDSENIKLEFDRKTYNFNFIEKGKEPYNLNQLSDGFSAIISIVTELIMRMEEHKTKSYDVQGLVLIDEIETHLHIDLQKKVLPFLTSFFPKIQFIVSTHSPFVISSIENAVICDLEKEIVTTDLSGYSYDTLIESYFNYDKYSTVLKNKIEKYQVLMSKEKLSDTEKELLFEIKQYLKEIPKFISDELAVKLQQIKLKYLKKGDF